MRRFTRTLIGVEDLDLGNNDNQINYHRNLGLLSEAVGSKTLFNLPEYVNTIRFTGYYEEGDTGAGIYRKLPYTTMDEYGHLVGEDIGVILNTARAQYKREFQAPYVNIAWFGAKGDGKTNDAAAFLRAIYHNKVRLENKQYLIAVDRQYNISIKADFEMQGNQSTLIFQSTNPELESILELSCPNKVLYFIMSGIKIQYNTKLPFSVTITDVPNIQYIEVVDDMKYSPAVSDYRWSLFTSEKLTKNKAQTITGKLNFKNHINYKGTASSYGTRSIIQDSIKNYVNLDGYQILNKDNTINSYKTYTKPVIANSYDSQNAAITKGFLNHTLETIFLSPKYSKNLWQYSLSERVSVNLKQQIGHFTNALDMALYFIKKYNAMQADLVTFNHQVETKALVYGLPPFTLSIRDKYVNIHTTFYYQDTYLLRYPVTLETNILAAAEKLVDMPNDKAYIVVNINSYKYHIELQNYEDVYDIGTKILYDQSLKDNIIASEAQDIVLDNSVILHFDRKIETTEEDTALGSYTIEEGTTPTLTWVDIDETELSLVAATITADDLSCYYPGGEENITQSVLMEVNEKYKDLEDTLLLDPVVELSSKFGGVGLDRLRPPVNCILYQADSPKNTYPHTEWTVLATDTSTKLSYWKRTA